MRTFAFRKPDNDEKCFALGEGEFSLRREEAFNNHLLKLNKTAKFITHRFQHYFDSPRKHRLILYIICQRTPMWY